MAADKKKPDPDRAERWPVGYEGRLVHENDEWDEVRVVDLSYDGCRIHTKASLKVGQKITLFVGIRGNIEGTIRWVKAEEAGVLFDAPDRSEEYWPRQAERRNVEATVSLRQPGRENYNAIVHDFSTHGCQVEFAVRPKLSEDLHLKIPGLDMLAGEVRWVKEDRAGIRFENPIYPAVFELLVGKLTARRPKI